MRFWFCTIKVIRSFPAYERWLIVAAKRAWYSHFWGHIRSFRKMVVETGFSDNTFAFCFFSITDQNSSSKQRLDSLAANSKSFTLGLVLLIGFAAHRNHVHDDRLVDYDSSARNRNSPKSCKRRLWYSFQVFSSFFYSLSPSKYSVNP